MDENEDVAVAFQQSITARGFCFTHRQMEALNSLYAVEDMPKGVYVGACKVYEQNFDIPAWIYEKGLYYEAVPKAGIDGGYDLKKIDKPPEKQKEKKIREDNRKAVLDDILKHVSDVQFFTLGVKVHCAKCGTALTTRLFPLELPYEGYFISLCQPCSPTRKLVTNFTRQGREYTLPES